MYTKIDRKARRGAVKGRIRKKISGSAQRPRLAVFRSRKHFYLQAVDDTNATTICSASTMEAEGKGASGGNIAAARTVGERMAERLKEKGIETVVFDRGGYLYHGRVQAAADAAREKGMKF